MHSNGHHPIAPEVTVSEFTEDILQRHASTGARYRRAMVVFGALFALGVVGFVVRAVGDGFDSRLPWGYFAATTAFLLTTAGTAPVLVIGMRAVKAHWRRPLARIAELYGAVGVLVFVMFLPLLFLIPSAENRPTLYFQGERFHTLGRIPGAPQVYDLLLLAAMVIAAVGMLLVSRRADKAVLAGRAGAPATGWRGTRKQWKVQAVGLGLLGASFFLAAVGAVSLFSIDFAMALVPGWRDAIFPAFQMITGLQGGLATVVLTAFFLRKYGHFERYIHMENFWAPSKIMLALTLLWFYFGWSGFIIFWYGRQPIEQNLMQHLFFGPYEWFFYSAFLLCFVVPFLTLLWNGVRKSTGGPALAAAFILVGNLMDKIRIYVGSFAIPNDLIAEHALEVVPPIHWPDVFDIMMMVGGVSGALFLVLWMARRVPILSLWEMAEGIRLRVVRPFLRRQVTVLGKPD
ncbi:MAG: hypothetical protein HY680_08945 [Chloroflexi bacterium]|nr:hypothetical protein [Chloroflexota bacterium]